MRTMHAIATVVGVSLLASSAAYAAKPLDRNPDKPGLGWGAGGSKGTKVSKGAPGPVVGAGLPFVLLGGIYFLFWSRRRGSPSN